jgi:hypothetical protein
VQRGELDKGDADLIEEILSRISNRWDDEAASFNADYLFDQTVAFFNKGTITAAAEEAVAAAEAGDIPRARIAGWRIATVSVPSSLLPDPWDDPEPPPFDLELLPPVLRNYADVQSRVMGCDPGGLAWTTIAACSGSIDATLRLQMKANDRYFTVPPGIWFLIIGDPSSLKSPILNAAFAASKRIQKQWRTEHQLALKEWLKEDEKTRGPKPHLKQLITNGTTPEGIRDLLVMQDRGIISLNDEWSQHIGSMGRYSGGRDANAADRGFWNTAYDGGLYIGNRAGRGGGEQIIVNNLQITVVGGIQLDMLRSFNRNNSLTADGMLQRSCVVLLSKTRRLGADIDTTNAAQRYVQLIRRLVAIPGGQTMQMSPEAQAVRVRVEERLEPWISSRDGLGQGFATAAGKLHGIFGRLALTLALVQSPREPPQEVDGKAAAVAERLIFDSLIPNLIPFYQALGGGGDVETTRTIAAFLLRQQRARVTASDVVQHVHIGDRKTDQVRDAMSPLVNFGWLTPEGDDERRVRAWEVNQAIYSQFADRAEQARMQAAMIREAIAKSTRARSGTEQPGAENIADIACARDIKSAAPPISNIVEQDLPRSGDMPRARKQGAQYGVDPNAEPLTRARKQGAQYGQEGVDEVAPATDGVDPPEPKKKKLGPLGARVLANFRIRG